MDPKILDDLARRVSDAMPSGLTSLQQDFERNLRAAMQNAFSRLDLVSREEFDVQSAVLARTRGRLEQLERQVAELEAKVLGRGDAGADAADDNGQDGY